MHSRDTFLYNLVNTAHSRQQVFTMPAAAGVVLLIKIQWRRHQSPEISMSPPPPPFSSPSHCLSVSNVWGYGCGFKEIYSISQVLSITFTYNRLIQGQWKAERAISHSLSGCQSGRLDIATEWSKVELKRSVCMVNITNRAKMYCWCKMAELLFLWVF